MFILLLCVFNAVKLLFNYTCVASHALLQQENPEYNAKRDELFNYYHPIEYDPKIPVDEKTKLMEEW